MKNQFVPAHAASVPMSIINFGISTDQPSPAFAFSGRELIDSLNRSFARMGAGYCLGVSNADRTVAEASVPTPSAVTLHLDLYVTSLGRKFPGSRIHALVDTASKARLSAHERESAKLLVVAAEKLTKSFLFRQREGAFMVSNVCGPDFAPLFASKVGPPENRSVQWAQICQQRANGRICRVFRDEAYYEQWRPGWKECLFRIPAGV